MILGEFQEIDFHALFLLGTAASVANLVAVDYIVFPKVSCGSRHACSCDLELVGRWTRRQKRRTCCKKRRVLQKEKVLWVD